MSASSAPDAAPVPAGGPTAPGASPEPTPDEVAERLLTAALGTADLLAVHLGDRLGWYDALAASGPVTADELAGRTGTHPRYAREWLEQQAVTGLLVRDATGRFGLVPAAAEVLTDRSSLLYLAPLARMFAAAAVQLPALLEAYRAGGGVSWSQLGDDARESQADLNRPWFESALPDALRAVPHLDAVLRSEGAVALDVGCGAGWSSIALARTYPGLHVVGRDIDGPSVDLARANASAAGVADRVTFMTGDAADATTGEFDVAFAFECVHDMPHPVEVLATVRSALRPGGRMVVMDEAVAERFTAPGDDVERLMYGFSLLVCLPDSMADPTSVGTGTVMRPDTLRRYALEAGFTDLSVLPIEDFGFWRFYELRT